MKFSELDEIVQHKIRKSILLSEIDFDMVDFDIAHVNINSDVNIDSLYTKNMEILFENNEVISFNLL